MSVCIFCLRHKENVAKTCTYGLHHEFDIEDKPKQVVKKDSKLCIKCNLHPMNPLSKTNNCDHQYEN